MSAKTPFVNRLIVNIGVRLGQKGYEATFNAKFCRRRAGVLGSAGAPQVKRNTLLMQDPNLRND